MSAYYNEHDPKAAAWLRELIKHGHISPGDVDERSIEDITPSELVGYTQCHFFAGIGGWSYALRLAGWPDDRCVCGPEVALASLSARQAKAAGLMTSGTYDPRSSISLISASLTSSLVSRLQARTALLGSTLFKLTWKERVTPTRRLIFALRASGLRTSDSGCTSWPTTTAVDGKRGDKPARPWDTGKPLPQIAALSVWPTPRANNHTGSGTRGEGGENLQTMASWATPPVRDHKDGSSIGAAPTNGLLGRQVWTAWNTPRATDGSNGGPNQANGALSADAAKAVSPVHIGVIPNRPHKHPFGAHTTLSPAQMGKPGQLNPAHSRWLMGYPAEWDSCGATAMQSLRPSRRSLSKHTEWLDL